MDDATGFFDELGEFPQFEDAELSDEIIYNKFALKLLPFVPERAKNSEKETLDFIVDVLHKIDTNESWDYLKESKNHRRLMRWLTNGCWIDIKTKFADKHGQSTDEDSRLLLLLDKIINCKKRSIPKKRKLDEVASVEESKYKRRRGEQDLTRDEDLICEENLYHDSNFVAKEYGKFAERLATLVPIRMKREDYTIKDIANFISYVLLKFDKNLKWCQLPAGKLLCSRFDKWRINGNWLLVQDKFLHNHVKDAHDDIRILSLLEKINNHQVKHRKSHKRKIDE